MDGEAKERFNFEFEEEMLKLSDRMSQRSLVCTVNRMTVNRMEEEEQMVDTRLEEVQGQGRNMLGRKTLLPPPTPCSLLQYPTFSLSQFCHSQMAACWCYTGWGVLKVRDKFR